MTGFIPSGNTRIFPVVGDPIAQVRSPTVVSRMLVERGEDAIVVPMHVANRDLRGLFEALHPVRNMGGALVTIPHKQAALSFCTTVTERAAFVGAVNVVARTQDGWHGDNTDGLGYLDGIEAEGFSVKGRTALLVGCGGAGSAIALEILKRGASKLAVHDIDNFRRDSVVAKLEETYPGKVAIGSRDPSGFDLVANATPLGMRQSDPLPIDVARLEPTQFVACVVTKPEVPRLIEEARKIGCSTMTGAGMFDAQAATLVDFLLAGWTD
ncbi:shikimate dehydrogenase [Rhizobium sp. BK602]|uniref:shikimate dehydrogenase family protein n=1 Tax=Rhizobium sp. BK602 TaxID=2586986 RepID=UPI00161C1C8C|nr:shikimate dehydrogenase [Rhizobium sp. BK602]MBB3613027.1 shikimate dehydrogenase [Rhizobium sp. BK602]